MTKRLFIWLLFAAALCVGSGNRVVNHGAIVYDTDAQAYFDAITSAGSTIDTTGKNAVNGFVVGCKADSIWTLLLDVGVYCGADVTAACVKLKAFGASGASYGQHGAAGTYSQSTGFVGNGTTTYLSTGVNGTDLTANSTGLAVYDRSTANATSNPCGVIHNSASGFYLYGPYSDNTPYSAQYDDASSIGGSAITGAVGFLHATCRASVGLVLYRNGSSVGSNATPTGTLPSEEIYFFALHNVPGANEFSSHTYSFTAITAGFDATQAANLSTRVQALQTALGR